MAKRKRYDEGGMTDEEVGSFAGTPENESTAGMKEAYTPPKAEEPKAEEAPKKQSFKDAFAAARKAGSKTFSWEGKKFTTELASEKKAAPKAEPKVEPKAEPKKELKYQSLQDRARSYAEERAKSGVGMYGSTKREKEERKALPLKSTKSESGYTGMGSMKFAKGGSASSRADGIAMRGKTRGKLC